MRTCLSWRALTVETADAVDAGCPVEAGGAGTVVDVEGTVGPRPAVDANAGETAH